MSGFTLKVNTPGGVPVTPFVRPDSPPADAGTDRTVEPEAEDKPFKWMSELDAQADTFERQPWFV